MFVLPDEMKKRREFYKDEIESGMLRCNEMCILVFDTFYLVHLLVVCTAVKQSFKKMATSLEQNTLFLS